MHVESLEPLRNTEVWLAEHASKAAEKTLAIPSVHVEEKVQQARDEIRLAWLGKKP